MKILLIEDERKLAAFISSGLTQEGHVCDHFRDGSTGLQAAMQNEYDLILLDLMLPSLNGFDVLKNLRHFKNETPVIILSALNDTENVIKGLDMGAMDYLKKPFDLAELFARVRNARRMTMVQHSLRLQVEDMIVDMLAREVVRNGTSIILSNREFALLECLITNANRVLTKSQILEKVWDINYDPGSNIVEVHLYQLRKKIDKGYDPQLIHTIVGRGYVLKGKVEKI
jgi:DNA-binding response OmpR family regulator